MDERMLDNICEWMMGQPVSDRFKLIADTLCMRFRQDEFDQPYIPSLVDIEYLVDEVIKPQNHQFLDLKNIILTMETGWFLGHLLNDTKISDIHIVNIGDGELELIKELKRSMSYKFSNCRIPLDRVETLANAFEKSAVSLDFNDSDITADGLRIILRVLKENLKESKRFDYVLKWNQSFDINQLGLGELLDCVDDHELTVHNNNYDGTNILINNFLKMNPFLRMRVDHNKSSPDDIRQFLSQNKNENWTVEVKEHNTDCLLLMSMIDVIKNLPMAFVINCTSREFISQEKVTEIMEGLIRTNLTDLNICIFHLTSDGFETIIDKLKNMRLQRLTLRGMKMINFNFQTVVEPFGFSELQYLSINNCELNYELTKEIFSQLENSKLDEFSIAGTYLDPNVAHLIPQSLIGSNLTSVDLSYCNILCVEAKVIAESLKNTNITSINLAGNFIENAGIEAIANAVGQTKLHTLILDWNELDESSAVDLLKSVQKTQITICCIDSNYYIDGAYEAIANVLADNKILLKCIGKGKNEKVDGYLERNNNSLEKAKLILDKYQKGTILYDYKYKNYFEAYESFVDTDILWTNINDKQSIKMQLNNKIKDNYLKICGVIKDKLEVNNVNSGNERNFSDLSPETMNKVCSNLNLSDVKS